MTTIPEPKNLKIDFSLSLCVCVCVNVKTHICAYLFLLYFFITEKFLTHK